MAQKARISLVSTDAKKLDEVCNQIKMITEIIIVIKETSFNKDN